MNPALSVIMGVYNGERYLCAAVGSILSQTFADFEFIVVDDGSTDSTPEILRSYGDPRLRIIRHGNRGLTKSLNVAAAAAKGRFLARQDADDLSLPDRFARQVRFLDDHPDISLIGSAVHVIDAHDNRLAVFRNPTDPDTIRDTLKTYNCFWHGSVMLRRECFQSVGGYCETFATAQDYDLWLRLSDGFRLANLTDPLYCYRFTTDSITVKRMVSQQRFADLARRLAEERSGNGETETVSKTSSEMVGLPLTIEEKARIIRNYKPWCRLLLDNGLDAEAGKLMSQLFRYHPKACFRMIFMLTKNLLPSTYLQRFLDHA